MLCMGVYGGERRISRTEFLNRMEGGWLGQIIGVSLGAPTEFRWNGTVIPEEEVPKWQPDMINYAFGQDDLYVEMTFLRSLEQYGCDVSMRQAGKDFAMSRYLLWCANKAGRDNLRRGIAPPDSSHPTFNSCPNDIDYQIESDYAGLIAPGMPQVAVQLGETFGRLMNYGEGVYGGQFMGGMLAEAFFSDDMEDVIKAGLACIPSESQYAEMVRDMLAWHRENPLDWQFAWGKAVEKYYRDKEFLRQTNGAIDVRINGAMVLLGLLYGQKSMEKTCEISMRGGFDSDCNPSSSCGVLGVVLGRKGLEERYIGRLSRTTKFSYTEYDFNGLIAVCEKLFREFLQREGGRVERDEAGEEVFVIPEKRPVPSRYQPSWNPGPIVGGRYTEEELKTMLAGVHPAHIAHIQHKDEPSARVQAVASILLPGWKTSPNAPDMAPGYVELWRKKEHVLRTHPLNKDTGAFLTRTMTIDAAKPVLTIVVTCYGDKGDFELIVRVNEDIVHRQLIQVQPGETEEWKTVRVDLSRFAGQTVEVSLENHPNNWMNEAAHWSRIDMTAP